MVGRGHGGVDVNLVLLPRAYTSPTQRKSEMCESGQAEPAQP